MPWPDRLKKLRRRVAEECGLGKFTQAHLAIYARVEKRTIESWEQGQSDPLGPSTKLIEQLERNPRRALDDDDLKDALAPELLPV